MLDACAAVLAVLYAASKGYLGHHVRRVSIGPAAPVETDAVQQGQPVEVPSAGEATVVEPAPSPVLAIYETVQPAPAPVQYVAPTSTSFGAPSISMPTKSYRRRPAPVGSTATKSSLKQKTKKRSAREEG